MIGRAIRYITESNAKRRKYEFISKFNSNWLNDVKNEADFYIVSFSGSKQFADQLYSIASFYRNVGRPFSWVIYNDGSYKENELQVLVSISGVQVRDVVLQEGSLPLSCFKKYPTLVKVELLRQLNDFSLPVLFTDSDILFYSGFKNFSRQFVSNNWYIVDEGKGYFDPFFELPPNELPLNFGFLVLNKPVDWSFISSYLRERIESGKLHYWSDQTAVHLLAQKEHFSIMPTELFVVGGNDSFKLLHAFDYNKIALRHFVGPVRHKMWQYSWKKFLGV
jgi:hypothetical protein